MKIAITGVPRSGKTTAANHLAARHGWKVLHTDDFHAQRMTWSEQSAVAASWFGASEEDGPIEIIEGVTVVRALRKWLKANPKGKPCDEAHFLSFQKVDLTDGQRTLGRQIRTQWQEIATDLRGRGVKIVVEGA